MKTVPTPATPSPIAAGVEILVYGDGQRSTVNGQRLRVYGLEIGFGDWRLGRVWGFGVRGSEAASLSGKLAAEVQRHFCSEFEFAFRIAAFAFTV